MSELGEKLVPKGITMLVDGCWNCIHRNQFHCGFAPVQPQLIGANGDTSEMMKWTQKWAAVPFGKCELWAKTPVDIPVKAGVFAEIKEKTDDQQ